MARMTMDEAMKIAGTDDTEDILTVIAKEFASGKVSPLQAGGDDPAVSTILNMGRICFWPPGKTAAALALVLCVQARERQDAYMKLFWTGFVPRSR